MTGIDLSSLLPDVSEQSTDDLPSASLEYLNLLNTPQRQAVETLEGPVLVLAGAGTGKTRVLTTRIAHILTLNKARPYQILAVTFTNKAAYEMKERLSHLIGGSVDSLWLGTFHSLCVKILRRHAEFVDLKSTFTILDIDDQLRLLKQILKAESLDDKKWPPRVLQSIIGRWKDRGYLPDKIPVHEQPQDRGDPSIHIYQIYQKQLKTLNAVDFGDLLLHCLTIFSNHSEILQKYQQQFRYILVDEYQDTNIAQYLWLRLLTLSETNLCCVGDDDQSIYGWRGAEITNILRFEKDFPGATLVRLEQNYRSTPEILGTASALIGHNRARLGKSLWTHQESGEKVAVHGLWDAEEEARFVGDEIERWQREGEKLSSMAILVRASHQTREFEDRFIVLGIPYRIIGGPKFYERLEIRDAMAYLRLVVHPDDSLAFERIINTPRRGIGDATLQTLNQFARYEQISLTQATFKLLETDELKGQARNSLRTFLMSVERWHQQLHLLPPLELAEKILEESGYTQMWLQDKSPEAPGRLENLKELVSAIGEFETLQDFLEHVALVMENNSSAQQDAVSIMTLHSAKGLEFQTVFLPGWEEGLFPNGRALDSIAREGLEEERRLAYVGLTRARHRAYISFAANRRIHGTWQSSMPSRFISELPQDFTTVKMRPGLFIKSAYDAEENIQEKYRSHSYSASPLRAPSSSSATFSFKTGERVFHIKFGYGHITTINGDKVEVNFDHTGARKVMAAFLKKT